MFLYDVYGNIKYVTSMGLIEHFADTGGSLEIDGSLTVDSVTAKSNIIAQRHCVPDQKKKGNFKCIKDDMYTSVAEEDIKPETNETNENTNDAVEKSGQIDCVEWVKKDKTTKWVCADNSSDCPPGSSVQPGCNNFMCTQPSDPNGINKFWCPRGFTKKNNKDNWGKGCYPTKSSNIPLKDNNPPKNAQKCSAANCMQDKNGKWSCVKGIPICPVGYDFYNCDQFKCTSTDDPTKKFVCPPNFKNDKKGCIPDKRMVYTNKDGKLPRNANVMRCKY
jgi:hypothetical protein